MFDFKLSPPLIPLPPSYPPVPFFMSNDLAISQDVCSPVIAVIPANHHAEHIQHVQSDCGHYGSPQVKRSHSLLRNFSLRSRNTLSLRKVNRVHCSPSPPSTSRPANVRTKSATASTDSSYSDTNSLSSTWKKWKPKGVTSAPGAQAQDGDLNIIPAHHDTLTCPQGSARKRSLFSPFLSVRRLIPLFQIPLSSSASSDDSPCVVLRPIHLTKEKPVQLCLDAIQDEDNNIVGNVGVDLKLTTSPSSQPPQLPPLPPSSSTSSPSSPLPAQPILRPSSSSSSPSLNVNPSLPLFTSTESSNPKPSISQNRRAQFTLGDESDLDCDSLAVSVSAMANAGRFVVLPNHSAQTSASIAMHRPPLTRREAFDCESRDQLGTSAPAPNASMTNEKSLRRWTLSSALTDEDISDEGLAKELERMRNVLEWDCTPIDRDGHDRSSLFPSPPSPSNRWMITQRALLTTRELILTERHYLSSLLLLLRPGSTLTPVPEMMVSYVKELVGVSERLLKGMEEEPSVRGVAEVFVGLGVDGVESAFAGWCGVVGKWFQGDLADPQTVYVKRKRRRFSFSVGTSEEHSSMVSEHEGSAPGLGETSTGEHGHTSPLMRNVSTWRKSMPSIAGLGESGAWRKDNKDRDKDGGDSTYGRGRVSPTFDPVPSSALLIKSTSISKPIRKPAVRDLAILPTQRVMRYVLLYRDLLAHTSPSSSSYPIVERAVEAACRIAEKCDRAQGNDAFVAGSTHDSSFCNSSSGSSSTSMANNGSGCTRSKSQRFQGKRVMTMPEPSSTALPSSESPTKSHFSLSSSPVSTLPSTSSTLPRSSSSSKPIPSFLPPRASPNKIRKRSTNPIPPLPPPPPSSFNSKIPIPRSGRSSGSLSTSSTGSSTTTATTTPPGGTLSSFSSSPSASSFSSLSPSSPLSFLSTPPPPPWCLPKSASSSSISSRTPLSVV